MWVCADLGGTETFDGEGWKAVPFFVAHVLSSLFKLTTSND